jgi:hypothetical protein
MLELSANNPQRTKHAMAETAIATSGFRRRNRSGPTATKTITSAATDSDQRALPTAGLIPAAFQAIIAKEPCIAWLPKINDATTINHLKLGDRSKSNTLVY